MRRWLCGLAALGALACGGSDSSAPEAMRKPLGASIAQAAGTANRAPELRGVGFAVREPVPGVPIEAHFEASDPDGSPLTFNLEWRLNGRVVQSGEQRSWTPGELREGDRIELSVSISDGVSTTQAKSSTLRMGNRPPEITSIVLEPHEAPARGDTLTATPVARDADGDELDFAYEWLVNGEAERSERGARFVLGDVKRGDRVRVRVRATDGNGDEVALESGELTIANAPPKLETFEGFEAGEGGFRHQMRAVDPDGDRGLRFVLAEGPRGMEIDPVDGLLTWRPEQGASGKFPVQVEVTDPLGASGALRFELTLGGEKPAASPQPAAPASSAEGE
jgi:hypothetical protein